MWLWVDIIVFQWRSPPLSVNGPFININKIFKIVSFFVWFMDKKLSGIPEFQRDRIDLFSWTPVLTGRNVCYRLIYDSYRLFAFKKVKLLMLGRWPLFFLGWIKVDKRLSVDGYCLTTSLSWATLNVIGSFFSLSLANRLWPCPASGMKFPAVNARCSIIFLPVLGFFMAWSYQFFLIPKHFAIPLFSPWNYF